MNFHGTATTVGSLPHKSAEKAIELILKYTPELPAWPQLPKRTFKENMYAQYSENFPGIIINEKEQKIYVDTQKALNDLEKFYEHYLETDLDYFAISEGYASGFYRLLDVLRTNLSESRTLKCQITGPLTFGLTVKDEKGQAIFYNDQLKDVVLKHITSKSLWMLKQLRTPNSELRTIVLSLDEPYLAAYGSAFTAISREDVINSLSEVIKGIKTNLSPNPYPLAPVIISVHCCANTDWSLLIDSGIDIISFDAYGFFDSLLLYKEKMEKFINRGGILAWGIVPTSEEALKKENAVSLINLMKKNIETMASKGIDKKKILKQMIITPACGLGSLSEQTAEYALDLLSNISRELHE